MKQISNKLKALSKPQLLEDHLLVIDGSIFCTSLASNVQGHELSIKFNNTSISIQYKFNLINFIQAVNNGWLFSENYTITLQIYNIKR